MQWIVKKTRMNLKQVRVEPSDLLRNNSRKHSPICSLNLTIVKRTRATMPRFWESFVPPVALDALVATAERILWRTTCSAS